MSKGIAITISRPMYYRRRRLDDAGFHSIWDGTRWVSLAFPVFTPLIAEDFNRAPEVVTTRLEFPPPGTVSIKTAQRYRETLLKEMQRRIVLR